MPMEAGQTATEQAPAAHSMDTKDGTVRDKGVDWLQESAHRNNTPCHLSIAGSYSFGRRHPVYLICLLRSTFEREKGWLKGYEP